MNTNIISTQQNDTTIINTLQSQSQPISNSNLHHINYNTNLASISVPMLPDIHSLDQHNLQHHHSLPTSETYGLTSIQLPNQLIVGFEGCDETKLKSSLPKISLPLDRNVQQPDSNIIIKQPPPIVRVSNSWKGWEDEIEMETEREIRGEQDKRKEMNAFSSFALGVFMGINPLLIALASIVKHLRTTPEKYKWKHSYFVYGRTLGLFLLITVVIVIIVLNFG